MPAKRAAPVRSKPLARLPKAVQLRQPAARPLRPELRPRTASKLRIYFRRFLALRAAVNPSAVSYSTYKRRGESAMLKKALMVGVIFGAVGLSSSFAQAGGVRIGIGIPIGIGVGPAYPPPPPPAYYYG